MLTNIGLWNVQNIILKIWHAINTDRKKIPDFIGCYYSNYIVYLWSNKKKKNVQYKVGKKAQENEENFYIQTYFKTNEQQQHW